MHKIIVPFTLLLLIASLLISLEWYLESREYEPLVSFLSLLAATAGLLIDRMLTERELRRKMLRSLVHEVYVNFQVLKSVVDIAKSADCKPKVLPRFYNTTVQSVLSTGVFAAHRDDRLWTLLHRWLQRSVDSNVRFQLTEYLVFTGSANAADLYQRLQSGSVLQSSQEALFELAELLVNKYEKESGIDRDTVIFPRHKV